MIKNLYQKLKRKNKEFLFRWKYKSNIIGKFFFRYYSGSINLGTNITINSNLRDNPTSFGNQSSIIVFGDLSIGNNVGISNSNIYCSNSINIGNDVLIGSNTKIFDTDFHDLNYERRKKFGDLKKEVGFVDIHDGVFIGSNCIIGKNVKIGEGAIIGAGSVIFNNTIEDKTVWAGNPAKKIKNIF